MNKLFDKLLDRVWDVMEPIAGTCPVCAFFRGAGLTLVMWFVIELVDRL